MSHTVIVTRAEPGAAQTAARVSALGFEAIVSPALHLTAIDPAPELNAGQVDGVIFTSANGVRFFADAYALRDLTAWCVGPATSSAAEGAGFDDIRDADGDANDLFELIVARSGPAERLMHFANAAAAGDLVQKLRAVGRSADFCALYDATPARALSPAALAALSTGAIVLIHSAKGAQGFLAARTGASLQNVVFVAVSPAASAPLTGQGAHRIICASRPNEAALMTALQTAALSL